MSEPIRSIQRALTLIRLMNKRDSWTLQQICDESGLAKATAFRILHTLQEEGYVHMPPKRLGIYRLSSKIRELGAGLTRFTIFADLAEPLIISATQELGWPVSFAMPAAPFMRIVSCGMPYSPEHSAKPTSIGREHWMFGSAVGAAFLSRCPEKQVRASLGAAVAEVGTDDTNVVPDFHKLTSSLDHIRAAGYALRIANISDLNSAMAVPVFTDGWTIGAIACSTFPHSLSHSFIQRMLPALVDTAAQIAKVCSEASAAPFGENDAVTPIRPSQLSYRTGPVRAWRSHA